jgi:hypothetical protein
MHEINTLENMVFPLFSVTMMKMSDPHYIGAVESLCINEDILTINGCSWSILMRYYPGIGSKVIVTNYMVGEVLKIKLS